MSRHVLMAFLMVSLVWASGCSRRQQEWEAARSADTLQAYQRFLASFPDGEFASQAQARVRELQEAEDWQKAMRADTPEAYQQFVTRHPQGRNSDEARIRIGNLALAQTPSGTPQEMAAPLESSPGTVATPVAATPGMYRIQLGAFAGGDKQAMGEWRRLQRDYPKLLEGLTPSVKLATTTTGHVYRLQAGMTNEARARDICAKLQDEGQACVVVLP